MTIKLIKLVLGKNRVKDFLAHSYSHGHGRFCFFSSQEMYKFLTVYSQDRPHENNEFFPEE